MRAVDRRSFLAGLAAAASFHPAIRLWGQERGATISSKLITPQVERAIRAGLDFLAARQTEEGALGARGYRRNVGVVSLAGMAFMAHGSTPGRGRYGANVNRCTEYLLRQCRDDGFIAAPGGQSHGPMYGHGFATLYLAEVYGMWPGSEVRDRLAAAVRLIVNAQNGEGGWRYQPEPMDADVSVTVCQVMALRAARNAGIYVPPETIDRAIEYVKACQNPDGGFGYTPQSQQSLFPRSAAAVVAFYSAGIYEGDELDRALQYLAPFAKRIDSLTREPNYMYGQYYGIQAMFHARGDRFDEWYRAAANVLLRDQRPDGSWNDDICPEYGTAIGCLVLQAPNNYLPILQR